MLKERVVKLKICLKISPLLGQGGFSISLGQPPHFIWFEQLYSTSSFTGHLRGHLGGHLVGFAGHLGGHLGGHFGGHLSGHLGGSDCTVW